MEKYINVMQQATELTETMVEGLKHIQKLLGTGKFEESVILLENVVASFASVEQSIVPVKAKLDNHAIEAKTERVKEALNLILDACEAMNYGKVQEMMQFTLIPQVQRWQKELAQAFNPYIAS